MNTIGNEQDAIIKTRRIPTRLKKDDEVFSYFFVTEVGKDRIIGYEDVDGNDVWPKVRELERNGWT